MDLFVFYSYSSKETPGATVNLNADEESVYFDHESWVYGLLVT